MIPTPRSTIAPLLVALVLALVPGAGPVAAEDGPAAEQSWKINLKEADIGEFVTQVARITGRNFVVDPRVKGRITVISSASLDREGVYELFLSVLRVHGFAAVPAGDVVKIVQQTLAKQSSSDGDFREDVDGELIVTRVIPAENVLSSELVKILRPLIPQYGHVASVDNPNVIILSDHAENIRRMEEIIREIDVADDEQVVVVPLEEAWVENVVQLLEALAPDQLGGSGVRGPQAVQVVANARNNSLVLRGKPGPIAKLRTLIARLDQPASRTGSTQVFRLQHGDAELVAQLLQGIVAEQAAGGENPQAQTTIQADTSLNAVVVRADPGTIAEVAAIIEQLDVRRTQVLIEAAIVEVSIQDSSNIGVDLAVADRTGDSAPLATSPLAGALGTLLGNTIGEGDVDSTEDLDLIGAAAATTSPTLAVAKLSNGVSFAAVLQALRTNSESDLLSTPSILTLDNEEASIVVGQNVPFRTGSFTTNQSGANNPFTTIQREDVGITLKVIPHIHDGNAVRLEVEQEVSSVVNSASIGESGFSDIVTNKRTIQTVILADDLQTIVLGGLIQDDVQETERRVPLLGSIPVAGQLFRSNSRERVKRNLLVFLRPTILRADDAVADVTDRKYRGIWQVQGSLDLDRRRRDEDDATTPEIDRLYEGREASPRDP